MNKPLPETPTMATARMVELPWEDERHDRLARRMDRALPQLAAALRAQGSRGRPWADSQGPGSILAALSDRKTLLKVLTFTGRGRGDGQDLWAGLLAHALQENSFTPTCSSQVEEQLLLCGGPLTQEALRSAYTTRSVAYHLTAKRDRQSIETEAIDRLLAWLLRCWKQGTRTTTSLFATRVMETEELLRDQTGTYLLRGSFADLSSVPVEAGLSAMIAYAESPSDHPLIDLLRRMGSVGSMEDQTIWPIGSDLGRLAGDVMAERALSAAAPDCRTIRHGAEFLVECRSRSHALEIHGRLQELTATLRIPISGGAPHIWPPAGANEDMHRPAANFRFLGYDWKIDSPTGVVTRGLPDASLWRLVGRLLQAIPAKDLSWIGVDRVGWLTRPWVEAWTAHAAHAQMSAPQQAFLEMLLRSFRLDPDTLRRFLAYAKVDLFAPIGPLGSLLSGSPTADLTPAGVVAEGWRTRLATVRNDAVQDLDRARQVSRSLATRQQVTP